MAGPARPSPRSRPRRHERGHVQLRDHRRQSRSKSTRPRPRSVTPATGWGGVSHESVRSGAAGRRSLVRALSHWPPAAPPAGSARDGDVRRHLGRPAFRAANQLDARTGCWHGGRIEAGRRASWHSRMRRASRARAGPLPHRPARRPIGSANGTSRLDGRLPVAPIVTARGSGDLRSRGDLPVRGMPTSWAPSVLVQGCSARSSAKTLRYAGALAGLVDPEGCSACPAGSGPPPLRRVAGQSTGGQAPAGRRSSRNRPADRSRPRCRDHGDRRARADLGDRRATGRDQRARSGGRAQQQLHSRARSARRSDPTGPGAATGDVGGSDRAAATGQPVHQRGRRSRGRWPRLVRRARWRRWNEATIGTPCSDRSIGRPGIGHRTSVGQLGWSTRRSSRSSMAREVVDR